MLGLGFKWNVIKINSYFVQRLIIYFLMAIIKSILIFAILAFSAFSANLIEQDTQLSIDSELELAEYLKAILGHNTPDFSQELKNFISQNEMSVLTAAEEIALVLTDGQKQEDDSKSFNISPQFLAHLGDSFAKINTFDLSGKTAQQVQHFIAQNLQGQSVTIMSGNEQEMQKVHQMMVKNQRRLLQDPTPTPTATSFSYITKFFFSLLFIIISLGSLGAIANMENRKDTLLYAKFIADVGR